MNKQFLGFGLIILAALIVGVVAYKNNPKSQIPIVFSETELLSNTWRHYKNEYLEAGSGRTLDKQQNNITTSEGQSYTMLRAVWMADKQTFDTSYKWAKDNLGRENDQLFSWLFGEENGKYTVLTSQGGANTATDADSDIAIALIFAYSRWKEPQYLIDAREIIADIWEHEVVIINDKPYLVANNLEQFSDEKVIVNPSYLSPYAYRIFAKIDTSHPWMDVVDTSYEVINKSLESNLDKPNSVKLPPDWIVINRKTGELSNTGIDHLTTNYSFDAMRTPWRLALDWEWFNEPRAKEALDQMSFLSDEWESKSAIYSTYTHDGQVVYNNEAPAGYGGSIGHFIVSKPEFADEIYENKLKILYDPDKKAWKKTLSYYDDNWVWLGLGLYYNLLPDLSATITQEEINEVLKAYITG